MRMTSKTVRSSSAGRIVTIAVLGVAVLFGSLSGPAYADGNDNHRGDGRGYQQDRGRPNERWRPQDRYDGYYSAPPVIYAPPAYYYQQPGASLNFSFPLFR